MSSLLPGNRTDFEVSLETSVSRSLPDVIGELWDPATCPLELLDYLAWGMAVANWRSSWPESIKRDVIKRSVESYRVLGTVAAVKSTLAGLNITVDLAEWFNAAGQPYTFNLVAWANSNITPNAASVLGPKMYADVRSAVDFAKPVRAHYSLTIGAAFNNGLAAGVTMGGNAITRTQVTTTRPPLAVSSGLLSAASASLAEVARFNMMAA